MISSMTVLRSVRGLVSGFRRPCACYLSKSVNTSTAASTVASARSVTDSPASSGRDGDEDVITVIEQRKRLVEHRPTEFQKRMLVLNKAYPSVEDVPEYVSEPQMRRAIEYFRIRVNIAMIVVGLFGCFVAARVGMAEREKGNTAASEIQRWHEDYNRKYAAEHPETDQKEK